METIAACGFEGRAPPPGEHSFTTSLVEVLEDWKDAPFFSITMLHSEVLRVLMRRRKEKCRNGQKLEWRSTPVHINNFTHPRTMGIELCKRSLVDADGFPLNQSAEAIEDLLQQPGSLTSATYLDLMSLSCDALEQTLRIGLSPEDQSISSSSGPSSSGDVSAEGSSTLKLPHMLVSIALDQDQPLPNAEACRRWLCAFPGLAKHVKVEGVYDSYSTILLLSIPVVIWNMMPDHPACQPIAYVTSRNLTLDVPEQDAADFVSLTSPTQISSATSRTPMRTISSSEDGHTAQMQKQRMPVSPRVQPWHEKMMTNEQDHDLNMSESQLKQLQILDSLPLMFDFGMRAHLKATSTSNVQQEASFSNFPTYSSAVPSTVTSLITSGSNFTAGARSAVTAQPIGAPDPSNMSGFSSVVPSRPSPPGDLKHGSAMNLPGVDTQVENSVPRTCTNCFTEMTAPWRRDPDRHDLCGACGHFLKLDDILRPLSLKTDVIKKRRQSKSQSANERMDHDSPENAVGPSKAQFANIGMRETGVGSAAGVGMIRGEAKGVDGVSTGLPGR
jgi:hypothetical protein